MAKEKSICKQSALAVGKVRESYKRSPLPSEPVDRSQPSTSVDTTYNIIGWVLQGGVILSAIVIVIGLNMLSLQPDKFSPQKLLVFPQTFSQVGTELLTLHPQAVIAPWPAFTHCYSHSASCGFFSRFCR
jgi:hypothetical protein